MPLTRLIPILDGLIDDGRLAGWVAGIHEPGMTRIVTAGRRHLDGPTMDEDSLFALTSSTKPIAGALALRLVELGALAMDDPVNPWLPELAGMKVLVHPDGPLDNTVPAERPITLRHLLTMTPGFGWVREGGPLQAAMEVQHLGPGPFAPPLRPDEYLARLGDLPLANQPGELWRYHTSSDVLGILLSRATGRSVSDLLEEHVTGPLKMADTGFTGDPARLTTVYDSGPAGELVPFRVPDRYLVSPPQFESLAAGMVASAPDYLRFLAALANDGAPILEVASALAMRTDQLTPQQRLGAQGTLEEGCGWGHHVEVRPDHSIGWAGGFGTIGYANPRQGRAAVLFTAKSVGSAAVHTAFDAFWSVLD